MGDKSLLSVQRNTSLRQAKSDVSDQEKRQAIAAKPRPFEKG